MTTEHYLCSGPVGATLPRSRVFEVLLSLADGVVKSYRSDLYHDAVWLEHNMTEPFTFYFSVDECGTGIGTDKLALYRRQHQYRLDVKVDARQRWTLTVTGA